MLLTDSFPLVGRYTMSFMFQTSGISFSNITPQRPQPPPFVADNASQKFSLTSLYAIKLFTSSFSLAIATKMHVGFLNSICPSNLIPSESFLLICPLLFDFIFYIYIYFFYIHLYSSYYFFEGGIIIITFPFRLLSFPFRQFRYVKDFRVVLAPCSLPRVIMLFLALFLSPLWVSS